MVYDPARASGVEQYWQLALAHKAEQETPTNSRVQPCVSAFSSSERDGKMVLRCCSGTRAAGGGVAAAYAAAAAAAPTGCGGGSDGGGGVAAADLVPLPSPREPGHTHRMGTSSRVGFSGSDMQGRLKGAVSSSLLLQLQ